MFSAKPFISDSASKVIISAISKMLDKQIDCDDDVSDDGLTTHDFEYECIKYDAEYVVRILMPDVEKSSIDIEIKNGAFAVMYERKQQPIVRGVRVINKITHGHLYQEFKLSHVDLMSDTMDAKYENGVLTVTIQMAEPRKKKVVVL